MADDARIEDLRRRVRKDPASMAFGALAEELRRAGRWREAVNVCRTGLAKHPDYLSARVTLGQALLALDHLDDAERELEHVRSSAPENLVATRALAEINARRAAKPAATTESADGLATSGAAGELATEVTETTETPGTCEDGSSPVGSGAAASHTGTIETTETHESGLSPVSSADAGIDATALQKSVADPVGSLRMASTLAALESWLAAIYVTRAE